MLGSFAHRSLCIYKPDILDRNRRQICSHLERDRAPAEDDHLPGTNGRAALHLLHRQIFGRSDDAPGISSVMMDAINITQDRIARSRLLGARNLYTVGQPASCRRVHLKTTGGLSANEA